MKKTIWSNRVRFVFVAGLEGTGHHGFGRLLHGLRLYKHGGLSYQQLIVDQWLSEFAWEMWRDTNVSLWLAHRERFKQRIRWCLSQHEQDTTAPPLYLMNTVIVRARDTPFTRRCTQQIERLIFSRVSF